MISGSFIKSQLNHTQMASHDRFARDAMKVSLEEPGQHQIKQQTTHMSKHIIISAIDKKHQSTTNTSLIRNNFFFSHFFCTHCLRQPCKWPLTKCKQREFLLLGVMGAPTFSFLWMTVAERICMCRGRVSMKSTFMSCASMKSEFHQWSVALNCCCCVFVFEFGCSFFCCWKLKKIPQT